jgi:hypothetical protein
VYIVYYWPNKETKNKLIIQDNSNSWPWIKTEPVMNIYKLIFHKNYIEYKFTPIFRTGDICGVKEFFDIRLNLLPIPYRNTMGGIAMDR